MARLKVYAAPMGFYEAIVAAPSQKAALAAWGADHDLFAIGAAKVLADDAAVVEAALKAPGAVLRRPLGGGAIEAASAPIRKPPKLPEAPRRKRSASPNPAPPAPPPPKPPPDRSQLDAAEKAVAEAEAGFAKASAEVEHKEAAVRAARQRLEDEHAARMTALDKRLGEARAAFERRSR